MKKFFSQLFQDKDGRFSLRETVIALLVIALLSSWAGQQFFKKEVPEFMFYVFGSLIGAGCFSYSIEKRAPVDKE